MNKTKIEWCDATLNPVVGCKRGCPYCYAKRLNDRFGFIKKWDEPQFFPERLKALESKKPTVFFMDSMSDIEYWSDEAWKETMVAIEKHWQHRYIFLTKYFVAFTIRPFLDGKIVFQGKSITHQYELPKFNTFDFFSIEPILESIRIISLAGIENLKAVIVGAETGNRQGKVVPRKEWIDALVKDCDELHIPIFMKNSLKELMGEEFRQDELPWYKGLQK